MTRQIVTDPTILKSGVRTQPVTVFFCGPGINKEGFEIRERTRSLIERIQNVTVTYGEDINSQKLGYPSSDLQTTEARFAHSTDLTLLMLQSPGSIAELGTFSMIENVRPRLFVIIPNVFYNAESYISRGPLSLIANSHVQNISYYGNEGEKDIIRKILFPISLAKYAKHRSGRSYRETVLRGQTDDKEKRFIYDKFMTPHREDYIKAIVYLAILINMNATYIDIINTTQLSPKLITPALRSLFSSLKIKKQPDATYVALVGYSDPMLEPFDTTRISGMRAKMVALA